MSITVRNTINNHNDLNNGTHKEIQANAQNLAAAITVRDIEVSNHYADKTLVNLDIAGLRVSVKAEELEAAIRNSTDACLEVE